MVSKSFHGALHRLLDRVENGEIKHPICNADDYHAMDTASLLTKVDAYCARNNKTATNSKIGTGLTVLTQMFRGARINSPAMLDVALEKLGVEKDSKFDNPHRYLGELYEAAKKQGFEGIENIRIADEIAKAGRKACRGLSDPISYAKAEKQAAIAFPLDNLGT